MPFCNETILTTTEGRNKVAVTLRCNSWTCELCVEARRQQLYSEILNGQPTRLLTLTDRRAPGKQADRVVKSLARALREIIDRERRHNANEHYDYFAVVERTRNNWPHLHVALRSPWIDQAQVSAWMQKHYDSPIVDIRKVKSQRGTATYLSNYISEDPFRFGTAKRYWHSKAYPLATDYQAPARRLWDRQDMRLESWCDAWRSFGWSVQLASHERAIASPPDTEPEVQR